MGLFSSVAGVFIRDQVGICAKLTEVAFPRRRAECLFSLYIRTNPLFVHLLFVCLFILSIFSLGCHTGLFSPVVVPLIRDQVGSCEKLMEVAFPRRLCICLTSVYSLVFCG